MKFPLLWLGEPCLDHGLQKLLVNFPIVRHTYRFLLHIQIFHPWCELLNDLLTPWS